MMDMYALLMGGSGGGGGGGSSGVMAVTIDEAGVLDKTWQEIYDANAENVLMPMYYPTIDAGTDDEYVNYFGGFVVGCYKYQHSVEVMSFEDPTNHTFAYADTANGYPAFVGEGD